MGELLNKIKSDIPFLKFNLKIKLTTLFLTNMLLFVCAGESFAQTTKIFLSEDEITVAKVIEQIENTTNYRFIYNVKSVDLERKVNINTNGGTIESVLTNLFKNTNTDFQIKGTHVILKATISPKVNSKFIILKEIGGFLVEGKLTDEDGYPLPGALVSEYNKSGEVLSVETTDLNGEYKIFVKNSETSILTFSYIGFVNQQIKVEGKSILNVKLVQDKEELVEVLVTGYQNITREEATGSFSKLDTDDFKGQRLNSLDKILEGRIVGYQGGKIRGTTSMNSSNSPLYVIDGFPIETTKYSEAFKRGEYLPNLNLEDIESITVLKDAAASSIYGALATNGVIVITTKKAKAGETNISFSSNLTVTPFKNYTGNITDSAAIIDLEKEWAEGNPNLIGSGSSSYANSLLNDGVYQSSGMRSILNYYAGNISEEQMNTRLNTLGAMGYKYYDDVARYSKRDQYFIQNNVSIGKASEKNSFNASLTYKGNKFEDIYSKEQSIGINLKNSTEITNWLTFDVGTYVYYNNNDEQTYMALGAPGFQYQPYSQLVNNDGGYFTSTAESRYDKSTLQSIKKYGLYNMDITPMDELGRNINKTKNFSNRTFTKFNIKFNKAFTYNLMFQYEYGVERKKMLREKDSYDVRKLVNSLVTISPSNTAEFNLPYGNILNEVNQFSNAYNLRQQLNYSKSFNNKHDISAIAGTEIRHSKIEYIENIRYGWDDEILAFSPVNQIDLLNVYGSFFGGSMYESDFFTEIEYLNRYVSFYGTADYKYDRRYSLSGSLRWDRSNMLGRDNNKPTWSVGVAWNIHNETFFQSSWIDLLKLRTSYGIGGNAPKDSSSFLTASYAQNSTVGGLYGSIGDRPNPKLSWEKTTTINLGLDFSLFENRLSGTFDFYDKKGENLFAMSAGVPTEGWGGYSMIINNGEMINKGIEVSLQSTIISTPSFSWDAGFMYAYNKNKVIYVNVQAPFPSMQFDYSSDYPRLGKDINSIYGYKWAGLSSTGLPQVYDATGTPVDYDPNDLKAIKNYGTKVPINSGSFNTSVSYKNFSISALFIYELGHKMRNTFIPMLRNAFSEITYNRVTNIAPVNNRILNRWQKPGDEAFTNVPRVLYEYDPEFNSNSYFIYRYADINIIDASNLRLSNLSFGYQMPSSFLKKVKLQDIRLNFNVENVFTMAKSRDAKYLLGGYQSPNFIFGVNINF